MVEKCRGPVRRAAHAWTFYVPGPFYGGWHLYIRTTSDHWGIPECDELALSIMTMFPCGLLPIKENFYTWKQTFAKVYCRGSTRRRQGMVAGWVDVCDNGHRPENFYY